MIFQAERSRRPGGRQPAPATIVRAVDLTPGMRRLTIGGPAAAGILQSSAALEPTAWLKIFPPGREGRAYTVRGFDREARTFDIDVALHDDPHGRGCVAGWARTAQAGDTVSIGGARSGSFALLPDARWLWIAVDAAALPAAHTILERLPAHIVAYMTVEVANATERQELRTRAELHETWRYSDGIMPPVPALDATMQTQPGQVWIAGESGWAKRIFADLQARCRIDESRSSVKAYWKIGESNHKDRTGHGRHR